MMEDVGALFSVCLFVCYSFLDLEGDLGSAGCRVFIENLPTFAPCARRRVA